MYYVYFLQSKVDNSFYIGSTSDLVKRVKQHNSGKTKSLKQKVPLMLKYYEAYLTNTLARKREIFLKKNWKAKEEIIKRLTIQDGPIV